jgi:hypothetical protein
MPAKLSELSHMFVGKVHFPVLLALILGVPVGPITYMYVISLHTRGELTSCLT